MKNETKVIGVKPLLDDLNGIREVLMGYGDPILASMMCRAIECVEKQQAVDAVKVVRCKNCKHRRTKGNCDGRPMDFYCADGEEM